MKIIRNSYFRGKVRSHGFTQDGIDYTSGTALPGKYNFGTAKKRSELLTIVLGPVFINGELAETGDRIFLSKGSKIRIENDSTFVYLCRYGWEDWCDEIFSRPLTDDKRIHPGVYTLRMFVTFGDLVKNGQKGLKNLGMGTKAPAQIDHYLRRKYGLWLGMTREDMKVYRKPAA